VINFFSLVILFSLPDLSPTSSLQICRRHCVFRRADFDSPRTAEADRGPFFFGAEVLLFSDPLSFRFVKVSGCRGTVSFPSGLCGVPGGRFMSPFPRIILEGLATSCLTAGNPSADLSRGLTSPLDHSPLPLGFIPPRASCPFSASCR